MIPRHMATTYCGGGAPRQGGPALQHTPSIVRFAAVREGTQNTTNPIRIPERLTDGRLRHELDAVHL